MSKYVVLLIVVVVLWTTLVAADDAVRPGYLIGAADFVVPENYDPPNRYPLVVLLPYTIGTPREFYERYARTVPNENIIFLLPQGRPQRTGFLHDRSR